MLKRFISSLLIVCLAGLSVPVHAGMLAIDADRAQIYSLLDREEVRNQLQAHGVSPADVKARVAAMTDEEAANWADTILRSSEADTFFGASNFYGYVFRSP